ncbi:MAG TPA: DUF72 domain-containing protein [Bacteroidota bacterium]|nr:DUF72 domain-containing protein [Bacteroidota bacterium]
MEQAASVIRIGMGGWEHEVFDRCLYGRGDLSSAEKLASYARYFQAVEVRATFWDDSLGADDAREWISAVAKAPNFEFNVKLHASFTHERRIRPERSRSVRAILQELRKHNRLGALLVQFPYGFTNTGSNRYYLLKLAEVFEGFPIHIEFRHESWNQEGMIAFLRELSLGLVSADLPRIRSYMPFITATTGESAYLRLHGRNEKGWMLSAYDARYDYLYNNRESRELLKRIRALEARCRKITVICNNTTGAKSLPLGFQLACALRQGTPVALPEATLKSFPFLRSIAALESSELSLLDGDYRRAI